jgi:hypothetical protein
MRPQSHPHATLRLHQSSHKAPTKPPWGEGKTKNVECTYAIYRKDRKERLFDNLQDPYQLHNLADSAGQEQTLNCLRALLKSRLTKLDDTFEASTWYRDHWVKDRNITRVR